MESQEISARIDQRQAALTTSLRLLNQTLYTFPQHIALQTMYEAAKDLRGSLAKLYPTLVGMYDKMTDIQEM